LEPLSLYQEKIEDIDSDKDDKTHYDRGPNFMEEEKKGN